MKPAASLSWSGWTRTEKPWDAERPFHRINCPTLDVDSLDVVSKRPRADGKGLDCGCREPADMGDIDTWQELIALLLGDDARKVARTVPSWVPVPGDVRAQEVQGMLIRSFQTWTDTPPFQWHRWYDWNFILVVPPAYTYLMGMNNLAGVIPQNLTGKEAGFDQFVARDFSGPAVEGSPTSAASVETMECEFDCGLFGSRHRPKTSPKTFGPMFVDGVDLAWPSAGFLFWGMGRWVYDCGHPSKARLTRTEIHPCTALATARWEAFKFDENQFFVPAVQFMFFATRLGGYTDAEDDMTQDFPTKDIEFIVDLPKIEMHRGPFPIGHTPEIPHNTIQLPRLLKKVAFPFDAAIANTSAVKPKETILDSRNRNSVPKLQGSQVEPIVKPIRPKDPAAAPEQVLVTIPFASGIPASAHFYGFILSLGWLDPDLSQARKVKKVTVNFDHLEVGVNDHDAGVTKGAGEWQIRAGVNGKWNQTRQEDVTEGQKDFPFKREVIFHQSDDQLVYFAVHGEETDLVHDIYKDRTDEGRVLMFEPGRPSGAKDLNGQPIIIHDPLREVRYFEDCFQDKPPLRAREVVTALIRDMTFTFNDQSDPLGIIDPFHKGQDGDTINPLRVSAIPRAGMKLELTGRPTIELDGSGELLDKSFGMDYKIFGTIKAEPQF